MHKMQTPRILVILIHLSSIIIIKGLPDLLRIVMHDLLQYQWLEAHQAALW